MPESDSRISKKFKEDKEKEKKMKYKKELYDGGIGFGENELL